MARRPYMGKSEAQANADALARRGSPYTAASEVSFRVRWDWSRREPADLREAVRMVQRAYSDEVPPKLHEGPDSIGPDGTPKMTPQAEGYIFGSPGANDDPDAGMSYYRSPFRAALAGMSKGQETERLIGAIVSHVAIGGQTPYKAAVAAGVQPSPSCVASWVAEYALRAFLRGLSDVRVI